MENDIVKELANKYNRKEKEIKIMINLCKKIKYNNYIDAIESFFRIRK